MPLDEDADRIGLRSATGLGVLVLAVFLAITTETIPIGLLPQLTRAYGVTASVEGLLVSVYAGLVVVLAVPITLVTARLPRKPLLLASLLLYCVGNAAIALAPSFGVVVAGRVVGGLAHALFFSIATAYAAGMVPRRLQGRAIAIALSGASLGYVLGVPLVTAIGAAVDQRTAFGALVVGGLLVALLVAIALPPIPTPPGRVPRESAGRPAALVAVASSDAVGFFGHYALYTFVSALLLARGLPEPALATVLFAIGAAGILGLWAAGSLVDRRPRLGLIGALAVALVCVLALGTLRAGPVVAVALTALWGAAFGAFPTFYASAALRTRVLSPDLSAAVNNAVSNLGIGGGSAAGAVAVALGGLPAAGALAVAGFLVALVIVPLARRGFPARPPA